MATRLSKRLLYYPYHVDVAGSYEYTERFLALRDLAHSSILITSAGVNPGIPGIVCMSGLDAFEEFEAAKISFILGSKFAGISPSSLKELKYWFDIDPLVWNGSGWIPPESNGIKEYVERPFEQEIYMGPSLTRDLMVIPPLTGVRTLSSWFGSQSTLQGLAMILGIKLGLANGDHGARFLLKLLHSLGRKGIPEALVQVDMTGRRDGLRQKKSVALYGEEHYAIALTAAILCRQIADGEITRCGAFVPPEIVPAKSFLERLSEFPLHLSETSEPID